MGIQPPTTTGEITAERMTHALRGSGMPGFGLGSKGCDHDTFCKDYRLALVHGWIIPVMAVGSLDVSSERAMALWEHRDRSGPEGRRRP